MGLKNGTVKLEKYNKNWEMMYKEEKANLEKIFGDLAIDIQHIGSTAIKNICAKPIIDIAVGVKSLKEFNKIKKNFLKEPYSIKEDPTDGEELVIKGYSDTQFLIHIMEVNSERFKNTILFRDYMNNNEKYAKEYEKIKIYLANKYANNRKKYTESKNEFIKKILKQARSEI